MKVNSNKKVMEKSRLTAVGLLTLALLQISQRYNVGCIDAPAKLENIHQRLVQLGESFLEKMRIVFYDQQQVPDNPPLHSISVFIAELEIIVYVYQRSALLSAEGVIRSYFIARTEPLEENLEESDNLIDSIVNLMLKRSADSAIRGIEQQRKDIFLLLRTYQEAPGILELAKTYFQEINAIKDQQESSNREFEESLERYRDEGWLFSQAHATESTVLVALDKIISRSMDRMNTDQLLQKYADPKLLLDVRVAKINIPPDIDAILVTSVTMKDVLDYENNRQQEIVSSVGIASYLKAIDRELTDMHVAFEQSMNEVFYQQLLSEKAGSRPLLSLAVQAAEIESSMYSYERNMLFVVKDMILQQYDEFNRIFDITTVPIDIIKYRLLDYAIKTALHELSRRRKVMYLLFRRYDYMEVVKELASRYFALIDSHKIKVNEGRQSLAALDREVSESLPEEMVPELMNYIDQMIEAASRNWFKISVGMGAMDLMKEHVDPILIESLRIAKQKAAITVDSFSQNLIDSVSIDDVDTYEMRKVRIGEHAPGIEGYLREIDDQIRELDEAFQRDFEVLSYESQLSVYDFSEDYALMALSAQMSELIALIYAGERRMLVIMKGMLQQQVFTFDHFLMVNKIPVEITMHRLTAYALENSLRRIEHRRRKIYIVLRRYDYVYGVKTLGRHYVERLYEKERKLANVRGLIGMYKSEVAKVLPPELLSVLMNSVDNLVEESASKWSVVSSEKGLLKSAGIPGPVLERIRDAKSKSYNKVLRPTQQSIDEIEPDKLRGYEEGLLPRPYERPPSNNIALDGSGSSSV